MGALRKRFLNTLALGLSFALLSGCSMPGFDDGSSPIGSSSQEDTTTYLVRFDTTGGSYVAPQQVRKGERAKRPENPMRASYSFVEWQLNGVHFDFNTAIQSDITLHATWRYASSSSSSSQSQESSWTTSTSTSGSSQDLVSNADILDTLPIGTTFRLKIDGLTRQQKENMGYWIENWEIVNIFEDYPSGGREFYIVGQNYGSTSIHLNVDGQEWVRSVTVVDSDQGPVDKAKEGDTLDVVGAYTIAYEGGVILRNGKQAYFVENVSASAIRKDRTYRLEGAKKKIVGGNTILSGGSFFSTNLGIGYDSSSFWANEPSNMIGRPRFAEANIDGNVQRVHRFSSTKVYFQVRGFHILLDTSVIDPNYSRQWNDVLSQISDNDYISLSALLDFRDGVTFLSPFRLTGYNHYEQPSWSYSTGDTQSSSQLITTYTDLNQIARLYQETPEALSGMVFRTSGYVEDWANNANGSFTLLGTNIGSEIPIKNATASDAFSEEWVGDFPQYVYHYTYDARSTLSSYGGGSYVDVYLGGFYNRGTLEINVQILPSSRPSATPYFSYQADDGFMNLYPTSQLVYGKTYTTSPEIRPGYVLSELAYLDRSGEWVPFNLGDEIPTFAINVLRGKTDVVASGTALPQGMHGDFEYRSSWYGREYDMYAEVYDQGERQANFVISANGIATRDGYTRYVIRSFEDLGGGIRQVDFYRPYQDETTEFPEMRAYFYRGVYFGFGQNAFLPNDNGGFEITFLAPINSGLTLAYCLASHAFSNIRGASYRVFFLREFDYNSGKGDDSYDAFLWNVNDGSFAMNCTYKVTNNRGITDSTSTYELYDSSENRILNVVSRDSTYMYRHTITDGFDGTYQIDGVETLIVDGLGHATFMGGTYSYNYDAAIDGIVFLRQDGDNYYRCTVTFPDGEAHMEMTLIEDISDSLNITLNPSGMYGWTYDASGNLTTTNQGVQNSQCIMNMTATVAGTLKLTIHVEGESGCDYLTITRNGMDTILNYGMGNYYDANFDTTLEVSLNVGDILTFNYRKDGSVDNGYDGATISNVVFTN